MNASETALQGKHTVEASELYMAFELAEKNWKLSLCDGARSPSRYTVAAGDTAALLECIAKTKARCGLAPEATHRHCSAGPAPGHCAVALLEGRADSRRGAAQSYRQVGRLPMAENDAS